MKTFDQDESVDIKVHPGRDYLVMVSGDPDLGGATLNVEAVDEADQALPYPDSTGVFETPKMVVLMGSGKWRVSLSNHTSDVNVTIVPSINFVDQLPYPETDIFETVES